MHRECPVCKTNMVFTNTKSFWKAKKHNSKCRTCFYKSLIGIPLSDIIYKGEK